MDEFRPDRIQSFYSPRRVLLAVDGGLVSPCGPVVLVPEEAAAAAARAFAFAPDATTFEFALVAGDAAGGGGGGGGGILGGEGNKGIA